VTSLALLFSTFSSPVLSAVMALALFVIGTFAEDLRAFAAASHGATRGFAALAAYLMPNLASLNVISSVAHGQPIAASLILYNTVYSLFYAAAAVCGAILAFEYRNLR